VYIHAKFKISNNRDAFFVTGYMQKEGENIEIDGITYIPVKHAADLAEYTADYVGQLCRGGKIDATRVGRAWYVNESSLIAYKEGQVLKDSIGVESSGDEEVFDVSEEVKKAKEESTARSIFKESSFVVYDRDDRPLIPNLMEIKSMDEEGSTLGEDVPIINKEPEVLDEEVVIPTENSKNLFNLIASTFARMFLGAVSFTIVFLLIFSLNGSYTGELIGSGVTNLMSNVASTKVANTVNTDILEPYRRSAYRFSEIVDESIHLIIYGEVIYDESSRR